MHGQRLHLHFDGGLLPQLRRAGAEVETADCARDGLRKLGRVRPDVLVSDIAMPEEDGYALIQTVRALTPDDGGAVPAIALTAYAREEDRLRSLEAGFQAHLAKPVEPGAVVKAVADLLPGPRDAAPPRAQASAG